MPNPLLQEARRRPERSDRTLDQEKGPGLIWAMVVGSVDAILGVGGVVVVHSFSRHRDLGADKGGERIVLLLLLLSRFSRVRLCATP